MTIRGNVRPGDRIEARLTAANTNIEPAELRVGMGGDLIAPGAEHLSVVQGTASTLALTADARGRVHVIVNFTRTSGRGELEIRLNGDVYDFAIVGGQAWWEYTVGMEAPGVPNGRGAPTVFHAVGDSRHVAR